jgi:hypothetical protein
MERGMNLETFGHVLDLAISALDSHGGQKLRLLPTHPSILPRLITDNN